MVKERKKGRRTPQLTKQGKYFILAIVFILLPAYLLSVSLLFLLGAMFFAILVYNLFLVMWMLRGIGVNPTQFPECFAGIPARIGVRVRNEKIWPPTPYLEFTLSGEGFEASNELLRSVPAKGNMDVMVTITAKTRGWLEIRQCRCKTAYPFGLVQKTVVTALSKKVLVFPALLEGVPPSLQSQARETGVIPDHGEDYQYLTSYQPGDDVRSIHWKKSTLLAKPVMVRDLSRAEVIEPKLFVADPCPQFEFAVSTLATYAVQASSLAGWAVATETGVQPTQNRQAMLTVLATIKPLSPNASKRDYSGEGHQPIYASDFATAN